MVSITKENGWEYDGPLSYTGEWHVAIFGFTFGILLGWNKSLRKEFLKEPYYFIGSIFIGFAIGYYTKNN
jgi:uncharacterized membrane protein